MKNIKQFLKCLSLKLPLSFLLTPRIPPPSTEECMTESDVALPHNNPKYMPDTQCLDNQYGSSKYINMIF